MLKFCYFDFRYINHFMKDKKSPFCALLDSAQTAITISYEKFCFEVVNSLPLDNHISFVLFDMKHITPKDDTKSTFCLTSKKSYFEIFSHHQISLLCYSKFLINSSLPSLIKLTSHTKFRTCSCFARLENREGRRHPRANHRRRSKSARPNFHSDLTCQREENRQGQPSTY